MKVPKRPYKDVGGSLIPTAPPCFDWRPLVPKIGKPTSFDWLP